MLVSKTRRIVLQAFDDENHKEPQENIRKTLCYCL